MLSGRLNTQDDWNQALWAVLNAPTLPWTVLTIISDDLTGSIGIKQGRFITGAHTCQGERGVVALRQLIGVQQGFYSYLSAESVPDRHNIDQNLNIDISSLVNIAVAPGAKAAPLKPEKAADKATAELRKTLQGLRPVSARPEAPPTREMVRPAFANPEQQPQAQPNQQPQPNPNWQLQPQNQQPQPPVAGPAPVTSIADFGEPSQYNTAPTIEVARPSLNKLVSGQYGRPNVSGQNGSGQTAEQPRPSFTGEQPRPQVTGEQPRPSFTGEQPGPQVTGEQPRPSFTGEQPRPSFTGEQPRPSFSGEQPRPGQPQANAPYQHPAQQGQQLQPGPSAPYQHPSQQGQTAQQPPSQQPQGYPQQIGYAPPVPQQGNPGYAQPQAYGQNPAGPQASPGSQNAQSAQQQQQAPGPNSQFGQPYGQFAQGQPGQPPTQQNQPQPPAQQQTQQYQPQGQYNAAAYSYHNAPTTEVKRPNFAAIQAAQQAATGYAPPTRPGAGRQDSAPDRNAGSPADGEGHQNLVDSVRQTAIKLASRVAMAAKMKAETKESLDDNRKLRTLETETHDQTETQKVRRRIWPPDATTIAIGLGALLGVAALFGGVYIAIDASSGSQQIATGKRYLEQGRPDLAVVQFSIALEKRPDDVNTLLLRAENYEQLKEFEKAAEDYDRLAQLKPKVLANARKAVYLQFKLHHYERALETCRKMLEANPDDESLKAQLAMNLSHLGQYKEATAAAAKLDVELVPPYLVADYFGAVGYAWDQQGNRAKAIEFYGRAIKADKTNAEVLTDRAKAYMAGKEYQRAIPDFAAAAKLNAGKPQPWIDLAKAYEGAGNFTAAAKQYEEALKVAPSADLYLSLAKAHYRSGKFGPAVAECDTALTLDPRCTGAAKLRTQALIMAKSGKALQISQIPVEVIVKHNPRNTVVDKPGKRDPDTDNAYAMLSGGNVKGAIASLSNIVRRSPQDNAAKRYLATAYMQADRPGDAFAQYNALSSIGAILPSDELEYAKCAELSGHPDRAIQLYFAVLARDPNYVQARIGCIKCLVRNGYDDKAQKVVDEGVKVNPSSEAYLRSAMLSAK